MAELALPAGLTRTRTSLHQVAEHVLAAGQYAATKEIALSPSEGGFRADRFDQPGRSLAVDGTDLVVVDGSGERRTALMTLRAAAAFAEVPAGFPDGVYPVATPFEPDAPLALDPASAQVLADWYALGAEAMRLLAAILQDDELVDPDEPSPAVLWPEHFDLGITAGAINYGASPGDATVPVPYVYVGPHQPPAPDGGFWNASFGAYRTIREIRSADQAAAFFDEGRQRISGTS